MVKLKKNENWKEANAARKFKTRNFTMTDEDHGKVKLLAGSLDVTMARAVVIAVEEKLDRLR